MIRWPAGGALASVLLALATACAAPVHERPDAELAQGRELYLRHCSPCHGAEGHGDGPVAPHLLQAPLDLTRITERRGEFDFEVMAAFVDGRERVGPHGYSDMPVWGPVLPAPGFVGDDGAPSEALIVLLRYLESIQREGDLQ